MSIKVTVNEKPPVKPEPIKWKDLSPGTVVEFGDGMIGLVYDGSCSKDAGMVFFNVDDGELIIAEGYLDSEIIKVLGTLTEIIVEEK